MRFLLLLLSLCFVSCGRTTEKKISFSDKREEIKAKYELYMSLQPTVEDQLGWILVKDCDALLFTSLNTVSGRRPNLLAARDENGQWFRRPLVYESCYPKNSASSISRDMFVGLMYAVWRTKQLGVALDLYDFGESNNWVMGKGDPSRTLFSPSLQSTLAEMIYRMGGQDKVIARNLPQIWVPGLTDYQLHLALLHIALRGELYGFVSAPMREVISEAAGRETNNALAALLYAKYISGDLDHAADLLLNQGWWPADRLPTTGDRRAEWITQRQFYGSDGEVNPDWLPVEGTSVPHTGGDFLFVAKLFLELTE
jgi:hypothetical protein